MTPRTPLLILTLVTVGGCRASNAPADAQPAGSGATATTARPAAGVRLEPSQLPQVRVEPLSAQSAGDVIRATGVVEVNADRIARILPPVSGQVRDLSVNVGDTVTKDSVLFVLSSREVAAAIADYRASHKDLDLAEKTYAMTQDLFEHQAASRIAQQQAANELAKARAKVQQTEEVLQVLGVEMGEDDSMPLQARVSVRTPIDGTVMERSVTNGQFVGPDNPPLLTVADLSSVWVQADVFERDLHSITVGQKADVTTTAYPDEHFLAQVTRVASSVDAQTRTAKVRIQVANRDARLKPGMFTLVNLALPATTSALTLPMKAVFVEGGRSFVYVQAAAGSPDFARKPVDTAPSGADRVRVVSGLSSGDRVVSEGVLLLRQVESEGTRP